MSKINSSHLISDLCDIFDIAESGIRSMTIKLEVNEVAKVEIVKYIEEFEGIDMCIALKKAKKRGLKFETIKLKK